MSDRGGGVSTRRRGVRRRAAAARGQSAAHSRNNKRCADKTANDCTEKHICNFFTRKMIKHLIYQKENKKREEEDKLNNLYIDMINY